MSFLSRLRGGATGLALGHRWSPFRPDAFDRGLHHPRVATVIGRLLGLCLVVSFTTGLYSHFLQDPADWMVFWTRPVWLYQLTQGAHVATGITAIPLLLAKLWTVYPRLFEWPPVRSPLHALERLSIFVFVSALLLEMFTGLINTIKWYPWPFPFRQTHYLLAWIIIGSLLVHIAVKLPLIRRHWRRDPADEPRPESGSGWSRRSFFTVVGVTTAAVTVTTVGQSLAPLSDLALLSPRLPEMGPQGLAVNRTAAQARVTQTAVSPSWQLELAGRRELNLSLDELNDLPQYDVELPIACVEGWSQNASWSGVRVMDLLDLVEAPPGAELFVRSLQRAGAYRTSQMGAEYVRDPKTLLALRLNGETLHIDHGYPARIIAPGRPGVLQTKWVYRMEVQP